MATTNVILWEGCTPVFVDIEPETFNINADKIEAAITKDTQAILATHVYGLPCNIDKIHAIAQKHQLKVIYDGAHAFGCTFNGSSLLSYGDISTCSFHATKVFHTVEGGCLITDDAEIYEKLNLYKSFGHKADEYFSIGINAKNSELHAAMGLAVLPQLSSLINERKKVFEQYNSLLPSSLTKPKYNIPGFAYNYSYYPVLFQSEQELLKAISALQKNEIYPRRYFYPSLNNVPQITGAKMYCPVSEDISVRVLCLPLYPGLTPIEIEKISSVITKSIA